MLLINLSFRNIIQNTIRGDTFTTCSTPTMLEKKHNNNIGDHSTYHHPEEFTQTAKRQQTAKCRRNVEVM